jgi:hypothetical protein
VRLLEPSAQEGAVAVLQLFELEGTGDLDVLEVIAAVSVKVELLLVLLDTLAVKPLVGLRDEPFHRFL